MDKKILNYVNRWEEKKIINSTQKNKILKDLETESSTNNFFKIIAIIGSLFIGIGALLLISSNWEQLPKLVKLILILLMPIIPLLTGYYLNENKKEYSKIGDSLIILSSLLIGGSLALFGQLYNIDGSVSGLIIKWAILTIPLTLIFRFQSLSAITISLIYIGIFTHIIDTNYKEIPTLIQTFTFLPLFIILTSYITRTQNLIEKFNSILKIFEIVSLKVLFFTLLIGTIHKDLYLLGESTLAGLIQHILFLGTIFLTMYLSNKNHQTILRNSTFFWLGIYMVIRYFAWFWDYAETGLFFVTFGIFLLTIVYGYIKITKNLDNKIKNK